MLSNSRTRDFNNDNFGCFEVKKFKNGKNDIKFILHLDDKKDNPHRNNQQTLLL